MTDWRDDPDVRAAIERAKAIMAVFTQARAITEAELALNGIHPVSVVHGPMESCEDEKLICGTLPELAEQCAREVGAYVASTIGTGDTTTKMFAGPHAQDAALLFLGRVLALGPPAWWRVTPAAHPRYDR
jgi:precorrin-4 methylase